MDARVEALKVYPIAYPQREESDEMNVSVAGVDVNIDWSEGRGIPLSAPERAREIPASPGLYAFVHYPTQPIDIRVGESLNIRSRFVAHVGWLQKMRDGSAREVDLRRVTMADPDGFMVAARRYGREGFEFHVVSVDPRLADKALRQAVEAAGPDSLFFDIAP